MDIAGQAKSEEQVVGPQLTVLDVARRVGRSVKTIHRLEKAGKIPAPARNLHRWRVYTEEEADEIDRIINSLTEPTKKAS